jgi:hypothetical protein
MKPRIDRAAQIRGLIYIIVLPWAVGFWVFEIFRAIFPS